MSSSSDKEKRRNQSDSIKLGLRPNITQFLSDSRFSKCLCWCYDWIRTDCSSSYW